MNFYKNLSQKEKQTVKRGAIALSLTILIFVIILPLKDERDSYRKRMEKSQKTLELMATMAAKYKNLKSEMSELQKNSRNDKGNFTLFSFLDKAASETGVKGNIKSMKPSVQNRDNYKESTVLVELEDVSLKPLVEYIHSIESSPHSLKMKKVDFKPRYSNPNQISVTMIISSIEMR